MKHRLLIGLLSGYAFIGAVAQQPPPAPTVTDDPRPPRRALNEGLNAYEKGEYARAADAFMQAAANAEDRKLSPSVPLYNLGLALYRMSNFVESVQAFNRAAETEDARLQQQAAYGKGNARYCLAESLSAEQNTQEALGAAKMAEQAFRHALLLNPDDSDAKTNFELADRLVRQLEQEREQQQQQQDSQDDQQQEESEEESEQQEQDSNQPQDTQDQQDREQQQQEQNQQQGDSSEEPPEPDEGEESSSEGEAQPKPSASEEMTEREAQMLLDAMKQEEETARDQMRLRLGTPVTPEKDW